MLVSDLGETPRGGGSFFSYLTYSDCSAPGITTLVTDKLCWEASGGTNDDQAATLQGLGVQRCG